MAPNVSQPNVLNDVRRTLPRWRPFATSVELGELRPVGVPAHEAGEAARGEFRTKLASWQKDRSAGAAAEVVEAAVVLGLEAEATEVAEFLVHTNPPALRTIRRLAESVLDETVHLGLIDIRHQGHIARLRRLLRDHPRHAVSWAELSREYAAVGALDKSHHAMTTAVALASSNRFVLRSAARLYVHLDRADEAVSVLRRYVRATIDPWLMAAELATSSVAGMTPLFAVRARHLLTSDIAPAQLTELAAASASLELEAGAIKKAKKLLYQALEAPNDNTVAQALWAQHHIGGLSVQMHATLVPHAFEAMARVHVRSSEWFAALDNIDKWHSDEPFSSRAAMAGSYFSLVAVGDAAAAERFARSGLRANPAEPILLNNLVVALTEQGRLVEAQKRFDELRSLVGANELAQITALATEGLLHFRQGSIDDGIEKYRNAVVRARRASRDLAVTAELYFLRECARAEVHSARAILDQLPSDDALAPSPELTAMLRRLRAQLNEKESAGR